MNTDLISREKGGTASDWYVQAMEHLVSVVPELSLARNLENIMVIVRRAARELTGADGATFVLRDRGFCYYADEDAIAPLWKGKRFPMEMCISGWVMLNRRPAIIKNIYEDARIPADAYRSTFVKSMVMVPIRAMDPVGAIGTYWATCRQPRLEEVSLLQALANCTSVAMENVQRYAGLEQKVAERTSRLQTLNEELDSFSHTVSHDLRAPLRHIGGFVELMQKQESGNLSQTGLNYLKIVSEAAKNMNRLMDDLLEFSQTGRTELQNQSVDLNGLVQDAWNELEADRTGRAISWSAAILPEMKGDRALLKQVWVNLLSNAVKYTRHRESAEIRVGVAPCELGMEFFVKDNGAGFEMQYAGRLFGVFQRLHRQDEFEGTGIGLATVRRIITRHGGSVRVTAEINHGATFYFTLPTDCRLPRPRMPRIDNSAAADMITAP